MLVDLLVQDGNSDSQSKIYAAAEILRQIRSPCKLIVDLQKAKCNNARLETKSEIIQKVCIIDKFQQKKLYQILHLT